MLKGTAPYELSQVRPFFDQWQWRRNEHGSKIVLSTIVLEVEDLVLCSFSSTSHLKYPIRLLVCSAARLLERGLDGLDFKIVAG